MNTAEQRKYTLVFQEPHGEATSHGTLEHAREYGQRLANFWKQAIKVSTPSQDPFEPFEIQPE